MMAVTSYYIYETQVCFSGQNNIIVTTNTTTAIMTISCTGKAAAMNLQKKILLQQNINIKIISSLMKSLKNTNNNIVGHQCHTTFACQCLLQHI